MGIGREGYLGDLEVASKLIPADKHYVMLNMMKFNSVAQYHPDFQRNESSTISGAEAYTIYREKFSERAAELGIKSAEVLFLGQAHTNLMAGEHEGEAWDFIVMVKFSSFASFRSVLEDQIYIKAIQPHRIAAVREFRSFAVTEVSL